MKITIENEEQLARIMSWRKQHEVALVTGKPTDVHPDMWQAIVGSSKSMINEIDAAIAAYHGRLRGRNANDDKFEWQVGYELHRHDGGKEAGTATVWAETLYEAIEEANSTFEGHERDWVEIVRVEKVWRR